MISKSFLMIKNNHASINFSNAVLIPPTKTRGLSWKMWQQDWQRQA